MHSSGVIIREHFGSSFCHLLSVAVNILPAASLNLATTYAGSRRFCTQQQFERSVTQCQCTKRISVRPGILVAMDTTSGVLGCTSSQQHALVAPGSGCVRYIGVGMCLWLKTVCSLPRHTSLPQLHLYIASFDFLFLFPLSSHLTYPPYPPPPAPSSQEVRLQEVGLGRRV